MSHRSDRHEQEAVFWCSLLGPIQGGTVQRLETHTETVVDEQHAGRQWISVVPDGMPGYFEFQATLSDKAILPCYAPPVITGIVAVVFSLLVADRGSETHKR